MKRASERQLTKDDPDDDSGDDANALQSGFQRASAEVMAKRRIIKARRTLTRVSNGPGSTAPADAPTAPTAINPFASLAMGMMTKTQTQSTKVAPPDTPEPNKSNKEVSEPTATPDKNVREEPAKSSETPSSVTKRVRLENSPPEKDIVEKKTQTDVKIEETSKVEANNTSEKTHEEVKAVVVETVKCPEEAVQEKESPTVKSKVTTTVKEVQSSVEAGTKNNSEDQLKKEGSNTEHNISKQSLEDAKAAAQENNKGGEEGKSGTKENGESIVSKEETIGAQASSEKGGSAVEQNKDAESPANIEKGNGDVKHVVKGQIESDIHAKSGEQKPVNAEDAAKTVNESVNEGLKVKTGIMFGGISGSAPVLTFASAAKGNEGSLFGGFSKEGTEKTGSEFKYSSTIVETKREFKEEKVDTGEEDEDEMFRARAKLYLLEDKDGVARWKERGVGVLKIKKNRESGQGRLLMRTEATLRVVLNSPLYKAFAADKASERSIRFQGFNHESPEADANDEHIACFLVRFSTKDTVRAFVDAVEEWKEGTAKENADE